MGSQNVTAAAFKVERENSNKKLENEKLTWLCDFSVFVSFSLQIKRIRKPAGVIINANKSIRLQIIDVHLKSFSLPFH